MHVVWFITEANHDSTSIRDRIEQMIAILTVQHIHTYLPVNGIAFIAMELLIHFDHVHMHRKHFQYEYNITDNGNLG